MDNERMTPSRLSEIQARVDEAERLSQRMESELFEVTACACYEDDVRDLLAEVRGLTAELSESRKAFNTLYGNHQRGVSPKVIACPVCGDTECIRLAQRLDAPELFGITCGTCGSHATTQLFAEPDVIVRLTAERDAAKRRADAAVAIANDCIYFHDSADYLRTLYEICIRCDKAKRPDEYCYGSELFNQAVTDKRTCPSCSGSGVGCVYDSVCATCHGTGEICAENAQEGSGGND